ncbi:MAG TPA: thiosulfate oxidation carrier protein SoxY [Usitatibacter sp.]|nr:thiosulfate oxidation carrier protein SoxY [Usitatibacter sp.]
MHSGRRKALKGTGGLAVMGLAVAAGLFKPGIARAEWNKEAFSTKSFADAVKAMGGSQPTESKDIVINSPDIAENGAVVPFAISSKLANTQSIALLIEKNPNILAADFDIPQGTDPWINTRVKMGQTSRVIALVKAGDKYYYNAKEVKVTLGGCGG